MLAKSDGLAMIGPMETKTLPIGHTLVETEDGSFSLFSEAFQEACHSKSGAKAETILHYIEGCKVVEKASEGPITILEVGFGLGVGFLTTLEKLSTSFHFISLEIDKNLLNWFSDKHPELKLEWKENILETQNELFKLTIIQGDARVELPKYLSSHPVQWNAIYQDAFSPKRNPSLWTKEWFELLKSHSTTDAIMSTYSASSSVRKSMHDAGWALQKGDGFGIKKTSTRAYLNQSSDPDIILNLERTPVPALTDSNLSTYV
jgi:tRNA U34 5-methylaminomethyl-2-thiouridine-forming methyltransferase MnmC